MEEVLRGSVIINESCIRATDVKMIPKKQRIIDFVENDNNKKRIAEIYAVMCEGKTVEHPLAEFIADKLGLASR